MALGRLALSHRRTETGSSPRIELGASQSVGSFLEAGADMRDPTSGEDLRPSLTANQK